jgi:hypothetical protein
VVPVWIAVDVLGGLPLLGFSEVDLERRPQLPDQPAEAVRDVSEAVPPRSSGRYPLSVEVDFYKLARLLEERLQPAVPSGVRLQAEGATLVMWTDGFRGRTHLALDYNAGEGGVEESLEDPIGNSLTQIADEASEATTDRYECVFAFASEAIRLWFGQCPETSPPADTDWSEVLPELPEIRFAEFVTDSGHR